MWIDQLHDLMAAYLASYNIGILSAAGAAPAAPMPVCYRSHNLVAECLVPRWADLAYILEQQPAALLIIPAASDGVRWLQYQGDAQVVAMPDWSGLLPANTPRQDAHQCYLVVKLQPQRLELFDQRRGWGARETLDLKPSATIQPAPNSPTKRRLRG